MTKSKKRCETKALKKTRVIKRCGLTTETEIGGKDARRLVVPRVENKTDGDDDAPPPVLFWVHPFHPFHPPT